MVISYTLTVVAGELEVVEAELTEEPNSGLEVVFDTADDTPSVLACVVDDKASEVVLGAAGCVVAEAPSNVLAFVKVNTVVEATAAGGVVLGAADAGPALLVQNPTRRLP